jgi:hypothetical protein
VNELAITCRQTENTGALRCLPTPVAWRFLKRKENIMSRHTIVSFSDCFEVTIGWDRPLNSFFAQVQYLKIADGEQDPVVVWVGASYSEIPRPEDLQAHIAGFAVIPVEMLDALRADRNATLDRGNTKLQRELREIVEGNEVWREEK